MPRLADQLTDKTVCTCICPKRLKSFCIYKIQDRPRIINIFMISENKSIIPQFYLFFLFSNLKPIQCIKYFFFCKSKCSGIFIRCGGNYFQIIQIRKNRLPADSRNSSHNSAFQPWIRLKRGIKQASGKAHQLIPITIHKCFLHRRIIFIQ